MPRNHLSRHQIQSLLSKPGEPEYEPLFTQSHHVWLASALRDAQNQHVWASDRFLVRQVAESLAESLAGDDPTFDKQRFLDLIFNNAAPFDHTKVFEPNT